MHRLFVSVVLLLLAFSSLAKVSLAVSNATSGPAGELGKDLNQGAELYFAEQSKLNVLLDKKDDGYEPSLAMQNTVEHVNNGHKLLFNYVGTPTTKSIINYAYVKRLTLVTPYTGADFLRQRSANHVFNLRASYRQEAELQAEYFIEVLKLKKVAIVIQADDFGLAFEKYFVSALNNYGLKPVFISRFKRNTSDVSKLAAKVNDADIQAIAFIGPYEPMSALINQTFQHKSDLVYSSVSFVSSSQLIKRIPKQTKLFVTEVVPNPNSCQFAQCQQFRKLAEKHSVAINHTTFEGYLNAYWLASALKACNANNNTQCITEQLAKQEINLLGQSRRFDQQSRQLLNEVFTTLVNLPSL